jgi:hypothetical protein
MERQARGKKSAHLRELEEVFEKRARRFSPFAILGLKDEEEAGKGLNEEDESKPRIHGDLGLDPSTGLDDLEIDRRDLDRDLTDPQVVPLPPMGLTAPPTGGPTSTHGSDAPPPGVGKPIPGAGLPRVVVVSSNTDTTTTEGPSPGVGLPTPPMGGSTRPTQTSNATLVPPPTTVPRQPLQPSSSQPPTTDGSHPSSPLGVTEVAGIVAATQLGNHLGPKAKQVLAYLNSTRSTEYPSYTVPVGYGQLSMATNVDSDYLRRKVLPKLAMLGIIAVARKSLEGTVYHLLQDHDYVSAITGDLIPQQEIQSLQPAVHLPAPTAHTDPWPDWLDRKEWGWLSPQNIRRLVDKAGSETQAQEKLAMIAYNETHGPPHQRIRNRRSVLAHYLSAAGAEIWPNDDGFETLAMRQSRQERDQAKKEKALAEDALRARKEAQRAQYLASLSDAQLSWLKHEAKHLVDNRPDSKYLSSRYLLYKAEEERLLAEWQERATYGEPMPSHNDSAGD